MRLRCQAVNITHVTSDVGAAGDGNKLDSPRMRLEQAIEMSLVQATERVDAYVLGVSSRPPGQVVAVMLHLRAQHHVVVHQREPVPQLAPPFLRPLPHPPAHTPYLLFP